MLFLILAEQLGVRRPGQALHGRGRGTGYSLKFLDLKFLAKKCEKG